MALALGASLPAGADTGGEGPHSASCREALSRLEAAQADAARERSADARRQVQALQRAAARSCLGGSGDPQPAPQAVLQPPVAVPSPAPPPPPVRPSVADRGLSMPVPPPRPVVPSPPPTVTACHDGGCWNSDGVFMPRVGPGVIGPGGTCRVLPGGGVQCP